MITWALFSDWSGIVALVFSLVMGFWLLARCDDMERRLQQLERDG